MGKEWTPVKEQKLTRENKLGMSGMWYQWWAIHTTSGAGGAPMHSDLTPELAVEWPADCVEREPPPDWQRVGETAAQRELEHLATEIDFWAGMHAGV